MQGKDATIGEFIKSLRGRCATTLSRRGWAVGRPDLVDDLTSMVCSQILECGPGFADLDAARRYGYKIIRFVAGQLVCDLRSVSLPQQAMDYLRRGRGTPAAVAAWGILNSTTVNLDTLADTISNPEEELQDRKLDDARARKMLAQLTSEQRAHLMEALRDDDVAGVAARWASYWSSDRTGPSPTDERQTLQRGIVGAMERELGIKKATLYYRLAVGWTVEDAKAPARKRLSPGDTCGALTILRGRSPIGPISR